MNATSKDKIRCGAESSWKDDLTAKLWLELRFEEEYEGESEGESEGGTVLRTSFGVLFEF